MPAPLSLPTPHPSTIDEGAGHRADLLRLVGVCDHCEAEMFAKQQAAEFAALPHAERIAARWADAIERLAWTRSTYAYRNVDPWSI